MNEVQGNLQFPDYVMIVGYFVLMLLIGMYFYRAMRGIKDYFSGGNKIPWWLSGVSFYMSSFSVAAFIMYPSLCYQFGWVGVTLLWVAVPATLFSTLFLARKWRRARIDSPVEYLEARYNPVLRQLFTWQGVPVKIIDDGIKIFAIGKFISVGLGFDMKWSMLGAGGIMLVYTFMGGLWAVAVTDFIQFIVLTVAIIVLLPLSLHRAGGFSAIVNAAPDGFFHLTAPGYGWWYIAYMVVMYSMAWSSINWSLIQRYYCVPRERDAVKVGLSVIALYVVGPPLMFFPAIAATRILPNLADAGDVYPLLCNTLLPAGMLGLVVAAMFAATMSMLSSDYNVCANVLTNDVYRRLLRPDASQRELVRVGRLLTILVGILALATAFSLQRGQGQDLFGKMVTLFSVATAPVAAPMILGLLSRRFTGRSAFWGFLCGLCVGLALYFLSWHPQPLAFWRFQWLPATKEVGVFSYFFKLDMALFISTAMVTVIVMILNILQHPMGYEESERVRAFFNKLKTPIGMLPEDQLAEKNTTPVSPFGIVGVSLMAIAALMAAILPWSGSWMTAGLNAGISLLLLLAGLVLVLPQLRHTPESSIEPM